VSFVIDEEGPATHFARHVIVPAAIIAMVTAFLFYLLEVRSIFLGRGSAFKQVGLCFSAATVLIARYGRVHNPLNDDKQGFYTAVLAVATLLFMMQSSGAVSFLPNLLIVAAVWRFAKGVTEALSLEEEMYAQRREHRLYGVERLRFEKFRLRRQEEKGPAWGTLWKVGRKRPDAHGNPVAAVARLAVLALFVFALGEPFLLRADPEVGRRALTDVIVFLFSSGVVLAAGSAAGTLRHALRAGGRVSPGVLPVRIALAALLCVTVLAAALTLPGVHFQVQGTLRATNEEGETGPGDNQSNGRQSSGKQSDTRDAAPQNGQPSLPKMPKTQPSPTGVPLPVPGTLVSLLSVLGKLLLIPLVLGIVVAAFLALRHLRPSLPRCNSLFDRLRDWLRGLRPTPKPRPAPWTDPFAGLGTLAALPPRDAVLAAYGRLLLALDQAGHPRPERTAPYEHLSALPKRLQRIEAPARTLTDLYSLVAYGEGTPTDDDRRQVLAALEEARGSGLWARLN
jgi:hypothetical protein